MICNKLRRTLNFFRERFSGKILKDFLNVAALCFLWCSALHGRSPSKPAFLFERSLSREMMWGAFHEYELTASVLSLPHLSQ